MPTATSSPTGSNAGERSANAFAKFAPRAAGVRRRGVGASELPRSALLHHPRPGQSIQGLLLRSEPPLGALGLDSPSVAFANFHALGEALAVVDDLPQPHYLDLEGLDAIRGRRVIARVGREAAPFARHASVACARSGHTASPGMARNSRRIVSCAAEMAEAIAQASRTPVSIVPGRGAVLPQRSRGYSETTSRTCAAPASNCCRHNEPSQRCVVRRLDQPECDRR